MFKRLLVISLAVSMRAHSAEVFETDVCVFGASSAGIVAAIQAKRMGKSVLLLEPGKYIGGLTTGGLGATDIGNKAAIGGISREFYHLIAQHYAKDTSWTLEKRADYFTRRGSGQSKASDLTSADATMWTFEPSVAENVYRAMLTQADIPVHFRERLAKVRKERNRISEVTTESGKVVRAQMFIDATYEGDLMAQAMVSYAIGREANSQYGETLNGIRAQTLHHQFTVPVDPYVKPSDAKSGLLPLIQPGNGGKPGEGDHRVQAYNYRLCFTTNAANRLPITPPPGYDPTKYELLARYCEALLAAGSKPQLSQFWNPIWMPNHKTDINNNGGFSTDFIGANYEYPEADYATRERIALEHEYYIRGFLTFLATSPRVPQNMREETQRWGLSKDEFAETGGWPNQLYVREARRMVGAYVMTEKNCRYQETVDDSIGLAAYNMDSHNCQRIVKNGKVENEGDVQVAPMKPYPISYRALIPKAADCENLFVPICMSASHIAYGSIRMEPVFMILGQSCATAAAMAIDEKLPVQKVSYSKLRQRLLADKQVLDWTNVSPARVSAPPLRGIVIDDTDARKTGSWIPSGVAHARLVGQGYIHDNNTAKGETEITYNAKVPSAGEYELILISPPHANRARNVPVAVTLESGDRHLLKIDQRDASSRGFVSLGRFKLTRGVSVTVSNKDTDGYVVADGLQLLPAGARP